jgi:hypothetical protein
MLSSIFPSRALLPVASLFVPMALMVLLSASVAADPTSGLMPESQDEEPISEAERLMWLTDQITNVEAGTLLRYRYEGKFVDEDPIDDEIDLEILGVNEDGSRQASTYFFTGDRNRYVAPHEGATGNPVLGVYLQEDVYDMEELTKGSWRYFHRRVKKALAHEATIEDVEVEFEGKRVAAKRISFEPFLYDEQRDQFENYAEKRYEVILSEQIPGTLYEVHTVVPGRVEGEPPAREETLRLSLVKRSSESTPSARAALETIDP